MTCGSCLCLPEFGCLSGLTGTLFPCGVGIIQVLGGFGFSLVVGVLGVWSLLLLVVYVRCCGWCAVWSVFHDWLLRGLVFVVIWWFRLVGCLVVWGCW